MGGEAGRAPSGGLRSCACSRTGWGRHHHHHDGGGGQDNKDNKNNDVDNYNDQCDENDNYNDGDDILMCLKCCYSE